MRKQAAKGVFDHAVAAIHNHRHGRFGADGKQRGPVLAGGVTANPQREDFTGDLRACELVLSADSARQIFDFQPARGRSRFKLSPLGFGANQQPREDIKFDVAEVGFHKRHDRGRPITFVGGDNRILKGGVTAAIGGAGSGCGFHFEGNRPGGYAGFTASDAGKFYAGSIAAAIQIQA